MDETEGTAMVSSSGTSSVDSGFDNGFLSDSSESSSSSYCYPEICSYINGTKQKDISNRRHRCFLNMYNISQKNIETLSPRTFQYYSSCLKYLNLSRNKIESLPETICQLKNLEELNLSHNQLNFVPESWKVLKSLKVLNLSNNKLSETPQCLEYGMECLKSIDLSCNNISDFEKPPMCLPVLQFLNLNCNGFVVLPKWLFSEQCRSLIELDMSFNFCFDDKSLIKNLPFLRHHRTSVLKNLKKLNISNSGSKVKEIITILCNFESLQILHMGNDKGFNNTSNHFSEIPINLFFNPSEILELIVPNVGLTSFSKELCKLEKLKILDLSENSLDWLPDTFGLLKSLSELYLSDCNLSYLPKSFNQLTSLKKLILAHNKLTDMRAALEGLSNLEWLDLYDNCLEDFPLTFEHLITISKVDVAFNFFEVEAVLDCKIEGESLLEIYQKRQSNLREEDITIHNRQSCHKVQSHIPSWDSLESLYRRSDEDSDHSEYENDTDIQNETFVKAEEVEDWNDISTSENEDFDPSLISRYPLPPGKYKFGWTPPPPLKSECPIPVSQILSGFVYVPGATHAKSTMRKYWTSCSMLQPVEGQFHDVDEAVVPKDDTSFLGLILKKYLLVRNPKGPSVRRCRICEDGDCWHSGIWIKF